MPAATWSDLLPEVRGTLPLGGQLRRTDPGGVCPAPIAFVGLYPALTRRRVHRCADGKTMINLPFEVEARSFEGSKSAKDLDARYIGPLGLARQPVFLVDLYPYYFANTAVGDNGRSMADNVERYERETNYETAAKRRPKPDDIVDLCRTLPGNAERLANYFQQCRPALIVTLGKEVAAYVRGYAIAEEAQRHLYWPPSETDVFGVPGRVVHCAHPGLLMRRPDEDPWCRRHEEWCAGAGKALVNGALRAWKAG